ncbi:MAG: zinc-binding alcohol dehydrogenase family protein [Burkholderiales bacterium]|nr:zinc-binding alcohol dehydrogenase family protein [Burkholderiales bacterium]MDE1925833.1 zinc-binding alcohol dehydrogenase family protein [Burkholderiales bacterium]
MDAVTQQRAQQGKALRLHRAAAGAEHLSPEIVEIEVPVAPEGCAVVAVEAAAVNVSDVKAALGMMPNAVWPRTPGRDFAGTVVAGPQDWLGAGVWGTGGDLGITRDGTHASFLTLPLDALSRRPPTVSAIEAAAVGVPFVTAFEGLRRAQLAGRGQTVLVFGANGKVGQAAVQLATRAGAKVVAVDRMAGRYVGHASSGVELIEAERKDLAADLLDACGGKGADIVFNTVGSPYFAVALSSLAIGGTQILISTIERTVPFDILAFYRRNHQLLGVDTLKIPAGRCAQILSELRPGFDDGSLKPFEVDATALLPLDQAVAAYRRVLEGSLARVVFTF